MLDRKMLKDMPPGTIFATGEGLYPRLHREIPTKWVAVRGGIDDWAIYYGKDTDTIQHIRDYGNKVTMKDTIKELVPCDDEAFKRYRY